MPGWLSHCQSTWRLTVRYVTVPLAVALLTVSMVPRHALSVFNALFLYLLLCYALALTAGSGPAVLAALSPLESSTTFLCLPSTPFVLPTAITQWPWWHFWAWPSLQANLSRGCGRAPKLPGANNTDSAALRTERGADRKCHPDRVATIVERLVRIYGAASCRILRRPRVVRWPSVPVIRRRSRPKIERQRSALARRAMDQGAVMGRSRTSPRGSCRRAVISQGPD